MRTHPKWTDAAYWAQVALRAATVAEQDRERALAAERKAARIAADVERFWAKQRRDSTGRDA